MLMAKILTGGVGLAALAPELRTPAQTNKLRLCFIEKYAPRKIQEARCAWFDALGKRDAFYAKIQTVMVMEEQKIPRDAFVLKRGAYDAPGEKVTPNVPSILPPLHKEWPNNRLGLARWLVDPANPLTAPRNGTTGSFGCGRRAPPSASSRPRSLMRGPWPALPG